MPDIERDNHPARGQHGFPAILEEVYSPGILDLSTKLKVESPQSDIKGKFTIQFVVGRVRLRHGGTVTSPPGRLLCIAVSIYIYYSRSGSCPRIMLWIWR